MYVIVTKSAKTCKEKALEFFANVIKQIKSKGCVPLLCKTEGRYYIAREIDATDNMINTSLYTGKDSGTLVDQLNIVQAL